MVLWTGISETNVNIITSATRIHALIIISGTIDWQLACDHLYPIAYRKLCQTYLIEKCQITCIVLNCYTCLCIESTSQTGRLLLSIGHTYITQFHSQNKMHRGRYIHTHAHRRTSAHAHKRTRAHAHKRARTSARAHVHTRAYAHTHNRAHTRMHTHAHARAHMQAHTHKRTYTRVK